MRNREGVHVPCRYAGGLTMGLWCCRNERENFPRFDRASTTDYFVLPGSEEAISPYCEEVARNGGERIFIQPHRATSGATDTMHRCTWGRC